MKTFLKFLLLTASVGAAVREVAAQPPAGSHLAADDNNCAKCHGEADLWEGDTLRLFVPQEGLAKDVHFLKGVSCHDCHGGDPGTFDVPAAHAREVDKSKTGILPFRAPLGEVRKVCGVCHKEEKLGLETGVHGKVTAGEPADGLPLDCAGCHGGKVHGMLPASDPHSPVFKKSQVGLCGRCHEKAEDQYKRSVHGLGLERSGLLVSAVCADCHGAHGIFAKSDAQSTLYETRVAATCAKCHRFIEERLQKSVHGRGTGPGAVAEGPSPGGEVARRPSCTDCHFGHDLPSAESSRFRMGLPARCGDCHADVSGGYAISAHGELTELGYGPAAKCSDCHGGHDVLPASDPDSTLSAANRAETCRKCHPDAPAKFMSFDPHADHRDPSRDPLLYWVYAVLMTLLISTIGFFGVHSLLWFVRSLIDVVKHGRPKPPVPGEVAYVRFRPFHRAAHIIMVMSFLGLAATGLPLKYSHYSWAQTLAHGLGGFESTGLWHRMFGVVNIGCLVVYVVRMLARLTVGPPGGGSRWGMIFGPDSPVPNFRDVKDVLRMFRWFAGLGPKPTFERWAYWEKVDFWGAAADIVIIGFTGLILWLPNLFCAFLPGQTLNIAKVIHSTQALLATGFVFAIHFFATHVRPEKFPMDLSVLTGLVSGDELREERPEYFERMRQEGKLESLQAVVPPSDMLRLIKLGGAVALAVGLALLAGIVLAIVGG